MKRLLRIARLVVPLGLAAGGAVLKLGAGQSGADLVLIVGAGALLGWAVVLALESSAALCGAIADETRASDQRLEELEREKEVVLRSIKDIELDAALSKLDAEEARLLAEPLRQRAVTLLYELDRSRLHAPSVEQRIEAELARRLGGREEETR